MPLVPLGACLKEGCVVRQSSMPYYQHRDVPDMPHTNRSGSRGDGTPLNFLSISSAK